MLSPLARALPAMTALQATVALGIFSLSVLAPQRGLSVAQLAGLNTLLFGVGALSALYAGRLLARLGDWQVAGLCAASIAAGMACMLLAGPLAPWCAALLFGLAFGPETPASASVLSRVTPAAQRPWVFSVRQTGNQIGAITGSIALPLLLAEGPSLPYAAVGSVAGLMVVWCWLLSRDRGPIVAAGRGSHDGLAGPADAVTPSAQAALSTSAAMRRVWSSRPLRALSVAALCYTACQVCLNTFLMSLAVHAWHLPVSTASGWVAGLQAAGLLGRLFWGWLAQRSSSAAPLLGALGVLMALSGSAVMAGAIEHGGWLLGTLVAVLGFTASGWNGVLVAEVSRLAGPREAGATTGAVLMFSYAGLAAAPLAFAALSARLSMADAFTALFCAAGLAGVWLCGTAFVARR